MRAQVGFLDLIFGKKKHAEAAGKKEEKPPLPLAIGEAEKRLRQEKANVGKSFGGEYERVAESIAVESKQLIELVERLSKKGIDPKMPGQKIGLQVRDDYAKKIPLLFQGLLIVEKQTELWASHYGKKLKHANQEILRITNNNRYLFHFFPDEMKSIAASMKKFGELGGQFEAIAEKEKHAVQKYEDALEAITRMNAAEKELAILQQERPALENQAKALDEQLQKAGKSDYAAKEEELRTEVAAAQKTISATRQQLAEITAPLQRVLRKYLRTSNDKNLLSLAKKYSENPVDEAIKEWREGGCVGLRTLALDVLSAVQLGRLSVEEHDEQKTILALERLSKGGADGFAKNAREAMNAEESASARMEFLLNEKNSFEELSKRTAHAKASIEKNTAATEYARQKAELASTSANKLVSHALESNVVIR